MFFFKTYKSDRIMQTLAPMDGVAMPARTFFNALTGSEKPRNMRGLLFALVLSFHLWAIVWMQQPSAPVSKAEPLPMEVTLLAAPNPQPAQPPAAQPKPEPPKKPPVKQPPKPKQQVIRKQPEKPKTTTADAWVPAPSKVESSPSPVASSSSAVSKAPAESAPFTEANFAANYGSNPKPKYPSIATSRGWQGTVRLLVKVSAEGDSEEVTVQRSSGHEVLDEAAIEAVERWKFIPAKRGDAAVASTVIVPIDFVLNN